MPDITFAGRAQQRVRDSVREHIGVGMTVETPVVRDFNSAKDQLSSVSETMHIVTNSNAIHG